MLHYSADGFDMHVTIDTPATPETYVDATLSVGKDGATVAGTMGGKLLAAAKPLPIGGHGTEADPFRVKFPVQEVVWFLP